MFLKPTYEKLERRPKEIKAIEPNRAERGQEESEDSFFAKKSVAFIAVILILFGLYLSSLYNYLLFHSLAEIFSIVVAWAIFIVAWNSRRIMDNNYLLFIGIAFLFIGGLDLVHTLGYRGMEIFHGYTANLPTQLWIAARYMESLSLLIAPLFLTRRLRTDLVLIVYALVTALVLGSVFYWHIFPMCFVEGVGLTPFKKISEYVISIILIGAITLLFQKRKEFDEKVFRLLVAAMVITIAAELAFTFYISAYGFSNLVGHYFKIISFYLIYKAIIETGLTRPYALLFRNLKRNEEALQKSEERFHNMFAKHHAVMLIIEPDTGDILDANLAAERFYGYPIDRLRSMKITDINSLPPDQVVEERRRAVSEERNYFVFPHALASGEERIVEVHSSPISFQERQVLFSIVHDITKRKKAEEEKNKLETQLQRAQKMEAIGALAGGIAHDFNNVLYAVMGYTELTMDLVTEGSTAQTNLQRVMKAADRAKEMVQQILAFSRQSKKEKKPISVQSVLKEAGNLLRTSIPSTIEIRQDIDTECDAVMADPTQIHQIIMNLATNAYHAMQETGGVLGLTLMQDEIGSDDLEFSPDLKPGAYLKLTVEDTGHGIDRDVMGKIFDPYFTTKAVGKGTGMGLSVVYGIVKDHGGDIRVYSEPGQGTAFHVYLPVIETDAAEPNAISVEPAPTGTERILFVDDEEVVVDLAQQMLETLGYHVTTHTGSVAALEAFRGHPDEFDLVITDMTMPKMTGAELAPRLLEIRPDIPIILCTGFSEQIDEARVGTIGIRAYLAKPILKNEMAKVIRKTLGKPNAD